jgi:hypothetical protein
MMCHVDQNCCAEMIVKDGWCYIVDDDGNFCKMSYYEFDNLIKQYNKVKK